MLSVESARLLLALLDTVSVSARADVLAAVALARAELETIAGHSAVPTEGSSPS